MGALVNGVAVCSGYAEAYGALLKEVGINSYYVSSDAMNHAWNMVYLDDYWYHVDVTWDDPSPWSNTYFGYKNNDYADIGYVTHKYFLKSDSEFLNLNHYDWTQKVEATNSSAFSKYCFYNTVANFMYYNDYWYYLNPFDGLYKVELDKNNSKRTINLSGNEIMYASIYGSKVYYADSSGVYTYDIENGEDIKIIDMKVEYPDYILTEFVVQKKMLKAVFYNEEDGSFKELEKELEDIPVSKIELSESSIRFKELFKSYQLEVEVMPPNAANKSVVWTSSDGKVAIVDNTGFVTVIGHGSATINVKSLDGNYTASCLITVEFPNDSDRKLKEFVERMYTVVLGRESDPSGLAYWGGQLKELQKDGAALSAGFILAAIKNKNFSQ